MSDLINHTSPETKVSAKAAETLDTFISENPDLQKIAQNSSDHKAFAEKVRAMVMAYMDDHPHAYAFYRFEAEGREAMEELSWQDYAAIRLLDYLDHEGESYEDLNLRGDKVKKRAVQVAVECP